ncbi:arylesterase [Halieaceae bacterium IMCC14734]|uniref:Arylesterase n=1 Tax=Candidatus Litorirhabdus singularis TaxID=2518993 RepID=A0ABT3TI97_9GAMM|nr:arylesterase [Candidatus Litorirhabdus singularis]MCX2981515.1 arylesterase [Candidatus Litorirhabdus singularis]
MTARLAVLWLLIGLLYSPGSLALQKNVLILGDSISAAYGMSLEEGWANLLQSRLQERGISYQVINSSISGADSSHGVRALPGLLEQHQPAILVLELGGNDGLRGYPLKRLRENLQSMISLAQQAGAQVILVGMQIPPNYGTRYAQGFSSSYQQLATANSIVLVPQFLENIARQSDMMQADGIHPTPAAQALLLENLWPHLEALLDD